MFQVEMKKKLEIFYKNHSLQGVEMLSLLIKL